MCDALRRRTGPVRLWTVLCINLVASVAYASPPVVPGYHRLRDEAKAGPAAQGELLLGELNCLACHKAEGQKRVLTKGAPDLNGIGARATPQWLRAYLSDPHKAKPGATMPDVFHASEAQAKEGAVDYLVHYLVSQGGPVKPATEEGNTILVEQGRALYHSVGCVACHAPEKPFKNLDPKAPGDPKAGQVPAAPVAQPLPSVPLGDLARKTTVDQLAAFLLDPLKTRPHSRMPSSNLTRGEAAAVATYLLREQMDNPQSKDATPPRTKGLKYSYYEADVKDVRLETLEKLRPKAEGKVERFTLKIPGRRDSKFALKFTGAINVPQDGRYTFYTHSDDGSRLYLDGTEVVANDKVQGGTEKRGSVELKAGDHPIVVTYFEEQGGEELRVSWEGPGFKKREVQPDVLFSVGGRAMVPLDSEEFRVDPQKAQTGARMFTVLGCASCHATPGLAPAKEYKPLAQLNPDAQGGCLSERPAKAVPKYDFSADQRAALAAAVVSAARDKLAAPLDAKEVVTRTAAAMNCYACHRRDNVGGPDVQREEFFVMKGEFDMGDEGRFAPNLSHVGAKLKPEAIEGIAFEGKHHVRPVLATRMPRFGRDAMNAGAALGGSGSFVNAVEKADAASEPEPPKFSELAARDGRKLVGTKGLGCVNCHGVAGNKSLGMPAPDLSTSYERLKYGYFTQLLLDPLKVNPGTRMPAFWTDGAVVYKDLGGGTPTGQINAIWAYVSLGKSMPLPAGIEPLAGTELIPADEPIIHRTFMADIGPRAILVGYPDSLNVAFDANAVRLAKAWRGRFFDAKGMWEGRGGSALGPLGIDVINLPPGPAFAVLADAGAEWPAPKAKQRDVGGQFKGYVLDQEMRPAFQYVLDGVEVRESPVPLLKPGGASLVRRFQLAARSDVAGLHFLAASGKKIEPKAAGEWTVDDKLTLRLTPAGSAEGIKPVLRDGNGGKQLVVPVKFSNGAAAFDVEMSW